MLGRLLVLGAMSRRLAGVVKRPVYYYYSCFYVKVAFECIIGPARVHKSIEPQVWVGALS